MVPARVRDDVRARFESRVGFELDRFQREALDALDSGRSGVVAAPTGSGKTVVADYAVARALAEGRKAFYTTPLKALSNQKYSELVATHGRDRVGLLTGDNALHGDADVVVMTTEVLRNMIYAGSPALGRLRYVILDEVHYLQNAYRGPVWEEVIIHAPPEVDLVCLSATVSNAEELSGWIATVRGDTAAVVEQRRPVELRDIYLVGDRAAAEPLLLPTLVDGRPNPEAMAIDARRQPAQGQGTRRGRFYTPRRRDVLDRLGDAGMLPAIYFIFSRKGCDEAVAQCIREGPRLTTPEDRRVIRELAEAHVGHLGDEDLSLLGYSRWLSGLEAGFAAHHAGLVPPFKEAVEACFAAGVLKVVFATETLSLGINMPARSVVVDRLTKFGGERHALLTAAEYAQLTGRAGRRGIDDIGYAVVPWSPWVGFEQVAALAGTRAYPLTSSFRPTYNMAVNLVSRCSAEEAHRLLDRSFAQYRQDAEVVRSRSELERTRAALAEARAAVTCERGDVASYLRLARAGDHASEPRRPGEMASALGALRPGDVLTLRRRRGASRVAVISTTRRRGGEVRIRAVTPDRHVLVLGAGDFPSPPRPVARVPLPAPYAPRNLAFQRRVAASLAGARVEPEPSAGRRPPAPPGAPVPAAPAPGTARRPGEDPVLACPELPAHLRALRRVGSLEKDLERLERRGGTRPGSLGRQLDQVLEVLGVLGHVKGWELTESGRRLARLYHESDLLVAETVEHGLLDGLEMADLAAVVSMLTFESRGVAAAGVPLPDTVIGERWRAIEALATELGALEEAAGLAPTRPPEPGFALIARQWALGGGLAPILEGDEITGGDFVRNVKQLVDLLRQLGSLAPVPGTAANAAAAAAAMFRGVVAASSYVAGA